jgi:hypothetical protein
VDLGPVGVLHFGPVGPGFVTCKPLFQVDLGLARRDLWDLWIQDLCDLDLDLWNLVPTEVEPGPNRSGTWSQQKWNLVPTEVEPGPNKSGTLSQVELAALRPGLWSKVYAGPVGLGPK